MIITSGPKVDPLTVAWRSVGKVVYAGNRKVLTATSARVARYLVETHNAALAKS